MRDGVDICFYCDACIEADLLENDHFPIPKAAGGTATVKCCSVCHDMKDRFSMENWSVNWAYKIINDFPKMSRETRIFLARMLRIAFKIQKDKRHPLVINQGGSMDEEQKAVVPSAGTAVSVVKEEAMVFDPSISQEDLTIPRVKLYQGNATEAETYPNAKGGQILNSLTQDVLQGEFIPMIQSFEWIKFNARNAKDPAFDPSFAPGALIWKTSDANAPEVANDPEAWKNRTIKFLCYFVGQSMPLLLTFSKTSYNAGKQLLSIAKFSGKKQKYLLTTKKEEKEGNVYYVFHVGIAGMPTDDELEIVNGWTDDFRTKGFKVHEEHEEKKPAQAEDIAWKE